MDVRQRFFFVVTAALGICTGLDTSTVSHDTTALPVHHDGVSGFNAITQPSTPAPVQPHHHATSISGVTIDTMDGYFLVDQYAPRSTDRSIALHCDVLMSSAIVNLTTVTFTWYKDGHMISDDSKADHPTNIITQPTHTQSILNATRVGIHDVGKYVCNVTVNTTSFAEDVTLYAIPAVGFAIKSATLIEGETLELTCLVSGWPVPEISWKREDGELSFEDPRVTLSNTSKVANTTLTITQVPRTERGNYVCVAQNTINGTEYTTEAVILVRVKERLAPLWPFIGILAEVIVLILVILLCEKQRLKKEKKEAAVWTNGTENGQNIPLTSPTTANDQDLRHRK